MLDNNLKDKTIVLCVCAGIAAYKSVEVLRLLQKQGARVRVIMTQGVKEFIGSLTFQVLSGNPVFTTLFDKGEDSSIRHIEWAEEADLVVIAPATANIIGKIANGIADDALSTFMLAVKCPVVVCPSMNTYMYENRAVQRNIDILEGDGFTIVEPGTGELACGVTGAGRFPEPRFVVDRIINCLSPKDLLGKKVLITAGPTREAIDPVRYISNHSSGKMGYAIAKIAEFRGADVTLISGPVHVESPLNVTIIPVLSALEMRDAFLSGLDDTDIAIKVAAVADYRAKQTADHKIKKNDDQMIIELEKNPDILKEAGMKKKHQFLVGFAAETRDLVENARKKLDAKNLDMIVGNLVGDPSSGFGTESNTVTLFYRDGKKESLESMDKEQVAHVLLDRIMARIRER
ncbi:MAG: bifunctional phosphopantothenoylcysteine decarboxylase/phosphopantothenate--cysteine ligase CoaBC [Proteobacteria bacterium]|nr:bifunctional phosphopantothenoylcysteine decarboxylase/phosphopantothenate--cysteine ligase CoaBC [Pseudomonadota bacterium]